MGKIGFLTHDEDLSPIDHPDCAVASTHAILSRPPKQWAVPFKQAFLNGLIEDVAELIRASETTFIGCSDCSMNCRHLNKSCPLNQI